MEQRCGLFCVFICIQGKQTIVSRRDNNKRKWGHQHKKSPGNKHPNTGANKPGNY